MALRPKASDIPNGAMVRCVWDLSGHGDRWVMCWEVDEAFPGFPPKVVQAKLSRLMQRGYIDGCDSTRRPIPSSHGRCRAS